MFSGTDIRIQLECPICAEIMKKVAVTKCGHRFCYLCIVKSIRINNKKCPICRKELSSKRELTFDEDLDRKIIEKTLYNLNTFQKIRLVIKPMLNENTDHNYLVGMMDGRSVIVTETKSDSLGKLNINIFRVQLIYSLFIFSDVLIVSWTCH